VNLKPSNNGILYGILAYGSWGLFPLYFKAVASVVPIEVLAHRVVWSFVILAILVGLLGRWGELWRELHSRKLVLMLGLCTLLIGVNWLTFIYSVASEQLLQASLGNFINPLINIFLGVVLLRERLRPYQMLSIGLAIVGVLVLTVFAGKVPWIALTLAITFSLYGLLRKILPVDGFVSLTVETLLLTPLALAYFGYAGASHKLTGNGLGIFGLLLLSGPMTTIPLLFFGAAARRLRLSTMGILQYLTPTLHFLIAIVLFKEHFSIVQLASFACIWTAIGIYTVDSFRAMQQTRLDIVEPFGGDRKGSRGGKNDRGCRGPAIRDNPREESNPSTSPPIPDNGPDP
jgi:chloramphenicol-sensitive protein RarD